MNRRSFLTGLIAAPAIIKVASIMPVRAIETDLEALWREIRTYDHFEVGIGYTVTRIDVAPETSMARLPYSFKNGTRLA